MSQNPLLLLTPESRARDLLTQFKQQKVIASAAWAKVVEELVEERRKFEVDYHPV